ncbi:tudor domain-containing 6-like [Aulostomus maculatus]
MSSIIGLPTRGSSVRILITRVHLHPLGVLVEFWGKFSLERTADFQSLAKDIQSPANFFKEFEGNCGDQCLAKVDGTWYRSRIVSRNGSKYTVFLIDKGMTYTTTIDMLAWGNKEHFHLQPEVEFCLLANVLPLPPENRWSPVGLTFLKSLQGQSVKAHVQDVLVPHRTFVLDIPCISKQMYEMGIAKKLDPDVFRDFVLMSLQSQRDPEASFATQQISLQAGERLRKQEVYMYPELLSGTVETVVVTEVTNPQRIFCQLKVFSQELKKLSEQITQCCRDRVANCIVGPEMIGFPCAARGSDGRWYRSVLQQVFPTNNVVEVLNVDYGTKQFVQVENVRPLAREFFRMPVVTYNCSLHGVIDKGVGWTSTQIDYLRTLLLHKTVIAKFEYQSISEGVYYVTVYGNENTNINNLFVSKENCMQKPEKTLGDYAIQSTSYSYQHPPQLKDHQRRLIPTGKAVEDKDAAEYAKKFPVEKLLHNSSHEAFVQHVSNPSEFWIQTRNYSEEFDQLMDDIYHLYKDSGNKDLLKNPAVGLYCAAKADDGNFYRAFVSEVRGTQMKVFFVDYGDTKVVDVSNIRTLPERFKKLPWLALKCTLVGVRPKDQRWNCDANDFFLKAVKDKVLDVHVMAKYDASYGVQLTDPEAHGERDLGQLMCSYGFAECDETPTQPKAPKTLKPAIIPAVPHSNYGSSGIYSNSQMALWSTNPVGPGAAERAIGSFKETMFPTGSILDVRVSYIESPNDFWCQLVQNSGQLKLLMHDIQAYYAGSEFQPLGEKACVACHPDNKMWYRALIIHKHETPHVDALFVDYGQTEKVSLYDLRRICPEFLTVHGQAFRCSLLNPIDPTSAINDWNEEATAKFHNFIKTAASNYVILKCTIYAVMYSEHKIVFNIVDLETPFESICTSLVSLMKSAPPKKASGSFCLDTYYYSMHNVKTGTEEQVTVTCVNSVSQFYCQLERNNDVIKDLMKKVNNLCDQLKNAKLPTVFGTLCFAKYTDGQWYRGQIKAAKPSILVFFVDYGDTIEVDKSDLLPVPREASDIMSVPAQAILCRLSDVPGNVPCEVNRWFETRATECKFRALIVAREPDGNLLVELYHGNIQINSKIKKMSKIDRQTEVNCQSLKAVESSANHAQKPAKLAPKQVTEIPDPSQIIKRSHFLGPKPEWRNREETKPADINKPQAAPKPFCDNGHRKVKATSLALYKPPHQRQPLGRTPGRIGNGCEPVRADVKLRTETVSPHTKRPKSKSPGIGSQKESSVAPQTKIEKLPKLADLPSKPIKPGMEANVYFSHCNSPFSFYVQLEREEGEIISLLDKLNGVQSTPPINVKHVEPGDLVQAEFADDSSWYRAVVREVHSNTTALVEFLDFGNTAKVQISKMGVLSESFLQLPLYCTHCMLSDVAALETEEMLDAEVVSAFKSDIGGNGDKILKCKFIRQVGSVWEVSLEDNGVRVKCSVPVSCPTLEINPENCEAVMENPTENSEKTPLDVCFLSQEFQEGEQLEVYVTTVNDDQSFWCQSADSEELDLITLRVSEAGDAAEHKHVDMASLSPGSPCIAVFAEDQLWYRAEIINKDGDELSVLFVDYGNKSQVKETDVREITCDLLATPRQAFLCALEGFDGFHGSWESGAGERFSALTADKLLQLTVKNTKSQGGKVKCFVQLELQGQVINKALKSWWRNSRQETNPDTASCQTPPSCDSTVIGSELPEEQPPEYSQIHDIEDPVFCVNSEGHSGDEGPDKWNDHPVDEAFRSAGHLETIESSEDALHAESCAKFLPEYGDQDPSECSTITRPEILQTTATLRERVTGEGVKKDPIMISQTNKPLLRCDSGIEDPILSPISNKDDQGVWTLGQNNDDNVLEMSKCSDGEETSGMAQSPVEFRSPAEKILLEAVDESAVTTTGLEPQCEEVNSHQGGSCGTMIYSDSNEEKNDDKVAAARPNSVPSDAVIFRKYIDLHATVPEISEDSMLGPSESVLPPCVLPVQQLLEAPPEQNAEAEDDVSVELVTHVSSVVKQPSQLTLTQHPVGDPLVQVSVLTRLMLLKN